MSVMNCKNPALGFRSLKVSGVVALLLTVALSTVHASGRLVDPTRPDYYTGADSAFIQQLKKGYKLSSIIVSDQRRTAVVNGSYVKEGEPVGEGVVRKIDRLGVTIEAQGARFTIALSDNNFKKRQVKR